MTQVSFLRYVAQCNQLINTKQYKPLYLYPRLLTMQRRQRGLWDWTSGTHIQGIHR